MKTRITPRRAMAVVAGLALSATVVAPQLASAGTVKSQALTPTAGRALDWLKKELIANNHSLVSRFGGDDFPDTGLTIDGVLALQAGGRGSDAETKNASDYIVSDADNYVTGFTPDALAAGPTGKLLFFTQIRGLDSTAIGGHNLEPELRSLLTTSGRFSDRGFTDFNPPNGPVDYSNGIGQALDIMALAATDDGAPATSVAYLLKQQCPDGGFRVDLDDAQCSDNADSSVDATAFALQGIFVADETDASAAAAIKGVKFLTNTQAANGSWNAGNANSTGLAASTLRAVGNAPDANLASDFIKTLQLTTGTDAGAIGPNKGAADTAKQSGLTADSRPVFARATTQAVLAMGLPAYILIGEVGPVEPAASAAVSVPSAPIGSTVTVSGTGFLAGETVDVIIHSDPITLASPTVDDNTNVSQAVVLPAAAGVGAHTIELKGKTSGVSVSVPITLTAAATTTTTSTTVRPVTAVTLSRTGSASGSQSGLALAFLAVGGGLVLVARRRRIIYPFKR